MNLLIIDANVASECVGGTGDAKPILEAIIAGKLTCVSGQKHKMEMLGCNFRTLYKQLLSAGKLREYPKGEIDAQEAIITPDIVSNDGHIIALARVSNARILFSRDELLHSDFTNPNLVNNPRGKVYQSAAHHCHLLR